MAAPFPLSQSLGGATLDLGRALGWFLARLLRPSNWAAYLAAGRPLSWRFSISIVVGVRGCLLLSIRKQFGHFVQVASPCAAPRHRGRGSRQCVSVEPWCSHAPLAVQIVPVRRATNHGCALSLRVLDCAESFVCSVASVSCRPSPRDARFEHYQTLVASRRCDLSNNSRRPSFCE